MEKVARAGVGSGRRWETVLGCFTAFLLVVSLPAVRAQEARAAEREVVVAQAHVEPPMRLQVQTSTLPRLDAQDSGFQAPRVDLSLTPLTASGSGLGAVVGLASPSSLGAPGLQPRTSVDLGLRWTQRLQSQHRIDITAWRRMNMPDDAYSLVQMREPVYGARVEMNLSGGRKSGLLFDTGFIGMQLEGGARITVKRKDGRPMVYYRTTF